MKKYIKKLFFSIIIAILGVYLPLFMIAFFAGDTNHEAALPYCLLSGGLFVAGYLWFSRANKKTPKQ